MRAAPGRRPPRGRNPTLIILVKEPVAGTTKTRLAQSIGHAAATALYRQMQRAVTARLGADPRWRTILAVSPDRAADSCVFVAGIERLPQGEGDLGLRMQRLFETRGHGPVVIVGTDIPGIDTADIAKAFRALGNHDAVVAPANDGGYWLIGLKRFPTTIRPFARVRWSTENALEDTLANLRGRSVARMAARDDVDNAADLKQQRRLIGRRLLPKS